MPGSSCLRRGKVAAGTAFPRGWAGEGAARGMDGAVWLSPIQDHLPGPRKPLGMGIFPQRDLGTAPSTVLGHCGAANADCLSPVPQGNDVLEDEDASPTQEDGKRPRGRRCPLSFCSLSLAGSRTSGRCCAAPGSPACWLPSGRARSASADTGAGKASVTGGLNAGGWGEASCPRGPP